MSLDVWLGAGLTLVGVYLRDTRRTNRDGSVVRYTTAGSNPHLLDPQVAGHRAVIDKATATREAHLDGKWLLRTSDQTLTADDLAAAYKQLTQIERGWRDLKSSLGLRPVFHYREDRIRAHIHCAGWLCCSFASWKTAPVTPGATSVTNSTECTWSPSPPATGASPSAR